jgi:hypothetical protein
LCYGSTRASFFTTSSPQAAHQPAEAELAQFSDQPEDEREEDAEQDHGRDGDIDRIVFFFDPDIAR